MTLIHRPSASPTPSSLALVVHRVCQRALPDAFAVRVSDLAVDGGVQVWLDTVTSADSSWVALHRIQRQLQQLGCHVERERHAEVLVVLGWSLRSLMHRTRLLRLALRSRLSDYWATAHAAVARSAHLSERWGRDHDALIVAAASTHVRDQLRWPDRLADLDGWSRHSELADHQVLLAQVIGLEAKIAQACEAHLLYTRLLAASACRYIARTGDREGAAHQVLMAAAPWLRAGQLLARSAAHRATEPLPLVVGGPAASLTERLIAVSVVNHGKRTGTSPRWW